jgi:hypothetical protein
LQSVKEENTVYVLLDTDQARPSHAQTGDQTTALIASLQDQVAYLRGELARREETHLEESRRKDSIIAALTQRIPELPPAEASSSSEPTESPETATEQPGRVGAREEPLSEASQSSWESLREEPERADTRSSGEEAREGAERRSLWQRLFGG